MTANDMTTIPAALASTVRQYPEVEAVVCGQTRLTYAQLAERVRVAARAFMASGVAKGDRVALWAPNSDRWIVTALAVVSTGAVLVPVNTRLKGAEARHILSTSQASILVVEDGFLDLALVDMLREGGGTPTAGTPVPALPDLRELIVFGSSDLAEVTTFDAFLARASHVSDAEADAAAASVSPEDPSDIIFTSGTTGRPKGATLLHGQTIRLYTAWSDNAGLKAGDRFLGVNPFFHCFGYKAGLLACVIKGATMVPVAVFDAVATMELIERDRINIAPGTPTLYITHGWFGRADGPGEANARRLGLRDGPQRVRPHRGVWLCDELSTRRLRRDYFQDVRSPGRRGGGGHQRAPRRETRSG